MKAITFEAQQSQPTNLDSTLFKSVSKSQTRRIWLRLNVTLRSWSRRVVAAYGRHLLAVAAVAGVAGLFFAAAEMPRLTAILAIVALMGITPEMLAATYAKGGEV